jgi:hypothetical protein
MAILQKTNSSTGNRKAFTWACWFKECEIPAGNRYLFSLSDDSGASYDESRLFIDGGQRLNYVASDLSVQVEGELRIRDPGSWMHIMVAVDTTLATSFERVKLYLNGRRIEEMSVSNMPARNDNVAHNRQGNILVIGSYGNDNATFRIDGYMADVYNVDGLALTPDVFGFYREGNGYVSAGTTLSMDFRPGQWVPKKPSVIKNTINNNGGFGVNGFYLPMNDGSNFGADFHCDPNSIITLRDESAAQPRNGAPTTTDDYVSQLRTDPYGANLVLAVPGIGTAIGPNLVSNGYEWLGASGTTPPNDWTTTGSTQTYAVNDGGRLFIDRNGEASGDDAKTTQVITTVSGKKYSLVCDLVARTIGGFVLDVGGAINVFASTTDTGIKRYTFTATSTTTTISMRNSSTSGTLTIDNFRVREVDDIPRDYSADIKGSGTNKTLTAVGSASLTYDIPSYYGSAMTFDGSGDVFTVPNTSDFRFPTEDFTIEAWVHSYDVSGDQFIFSIWNNTDNRRAYTLWLDNGSLNFNGSSTGATSDNGTINPGWAEVTADEWNHVAVSRKGPVSRLFLNGVTVGVNTNMGDNYNNTDDNPIIGGENGGSNRDFNGEIQDVRVYKGVAKYTGDFDVPRVFTPIGIATWRAVPDCTANNFATLNSIGSGLLDIDGDGNTSATYSNGSLTAVLADNAASARSTIGIHTGKWYWETRIDVNSNSCGVGIVGLTTNSSSFNDAEGVCYEPRIDRFRRAGTTYFDGTDNKTDNGLIVGVALDKNVGIISFFADGQPLSSGTTTGINALSVYHLPECFTHNDGSSNTFTVNYGQNPTFCGRVSVSSTQRNADANGKGQFRYAPPSGFLALCEDNLPTPAITDPGEHFRTVLYTGDGSAGTASIKGFGFKPDFIWLKARNGTGNHGIWDSVRGATNRLMPNSSVDEDTASGVMSFDDDGFSRGTFFSNGGTNYVAWGWKAGAGTTSTNTDGSIDSVVSVNQDAGFSIVSYTGNGSTGTVGHGLGKTPSFVIVKGRTNISQWLIWHKSLTGSQFLEFNTNAVDTATAAWNDTLPNSTTISLGSSPAASADFIAYCWAEIEGYSKFGSYIGNGDTDGPFVYCGFKPAWVMVKNITDTGGRDWGIQDSTRKPVNPCDHQLKPNQTEIENSGVAGSTFQIDIVSNGFKVRNNSGIWNNDGETIIFAAFAESPFKTSNGK